MRCTIYRNVRVKEFLNVKIAFIAVILTAGLAVVILSSVSLYRSHQQYQKQAETSLQNLCTVLSYTLSSSYEKIDLAILGVKTEYERQLAAGGINVPQLEKFINQRLDWIPILLALRTADANGIISHGNEVPPGSQISIADRDYFLRLKSDPDAGLVFSKPLKGRISGKWAIILARRINRPDGSFGGVAYGGIEMSKIDTYFSALAIGRDGVITLRDNDMAILLRRGNLQNTEGQTAISPQFKTLLDAQKSSGTFTAVSAVDGIKRIFYFIKIEPYGQYLYAGMSYDEVFRHWQSDLYQTIAFVIIFFLLISASTFFIYKAWSHQQEAQAEREKVIHELEKTMEEVKVLSGLLPICSNCKKIRDDTGYWNQIELYISSRSDAQFTHSICPDCTKLLYGDLYKKETPKT